MEDVAVRSLRARLARNVSWTFSAYVLTTALGTLALLLTSRALGPAGLGILALVEAYVRIAGRLLRIEPWQAIIRYASEALVQGDRTRFLDLVKLSILIDLASGILAGAVTIALAGLVAPLIGLPDDGGVPFVVVVAMGLFFSFRPTAVAVLRSFDRFDVLAKADVAGALLRFSLTLGAYLLDFGLWAFVAILLVQTLVDGLLAFAIGLAELRRRGYVRLWSASARNALSSSPGIVRFLWNSNFNVVLRQTANRLDVLALGALLDPVAVGYYHLGKRLMNNAIKSAGPLRQSLYPEMTRLWAAGKRHTFFRLLAVSSAGLAAIAILVAVPLIWQMDAVVTLLFGAEFLGASVVMSILCASTVVFVAAVMLNPALLSMGNDRLLLRATMLSIGVFVASFLPLVHVFGVEGAAMGNLLSNAVWVTACLIGLTRAKHLAP